MEQYGEEYAEKISDNVMHKLKLAMGIPAKETNPKKLHDFFFERFTPTEEPEFEHNVPNKP